MIRRPRPRPRRRRPAPPPLGHAGAVVARNYLAHARVLARSLTVHHPERRLCVLLIDGTEDDRDGDEPFELLLPADLGVSDHELHRRAMLYDLQGVISSLRPHLVAHLLRRGGAVLLLDVDMEVLAPLPDVWGSAEEAGVLLSPHVTEPLGGQPGAWEEELLLMSGTFNGGLLGVGPDGWEFLVWMMERTARDCVLDASRNLMYSQTWLNLVPALFPHMVLRDRGLNAMVHNLRGRDVTWEGDRPAIERTPLRLFHYTGFDPDDPDQLCRYFPDAFARVGERPGLRRLLGAYGRRLRADGWPVVAAASWQRLPDGTPIDDTCRAAFRRAVLAAERGAGDEPPDPFDPREDFLQWLRHPEADGVSRYLVALRQRRRDLTEAFAGARRRQRRLSGLGARDARRRAPPGADLTARRSTRGGGMLRTGADL